MFVVVAAVAVVIYVVVNPETLLKGTVQKDVLAKKIPFSLLIKVSKVKNLKTHYKN